MSHAIFQKHCSMASIQCWHHFGGDAGFSWGGCQWYQSLKLVHGLLNLCFLKLDLPMFWSRNCKMAASRPKDWSPETASKVDCFANPTDWVGTPSWAISCRLWKVSITMGLQVLWLFLGACWVCCGAFCCLLVCCCGFHVSLLLVSRSLVRGVWMRLAWDGWIVHGKLMCHNCGNGRWSLDEFQSAFEILAPSKNLENCW